MLSTLPKLVDKPFIIGFIVPVLVGGLAIVGLLHDLPPFSSIYSSVLAGDSFTKLTIFVLSLWTLAILLLLLNYRLYRLLEGYVGPFARKAWRDSMRAKYKRQADALARKYRDFPILSREARSDYYAALQRFAVEWPSESRLVLPTRFGNVIRGAETYPLKVYGVDSIAAWSRLEPLIAKEFQATIEDARAQVDFFVNSWIFSILFADIAIARSLFALYFNFRVPSTLVSAIWEFSDVWGFAAAAAGALLLALAAYEGAVERATGWGELVKSAFDLYLPVLAKQLGYELPSKEAERRRFWRAVNYMFLYQRPLRPENWPKVISVEKTGDSKGGSDQPKNAPDGKDGVDAADKGEVGPDALEKTVGQSEILT